MGLCGRVEGKGQVNLLHFQTGQPDLEEALQGKKGPIGTVLPVVSFRHHGLDCGR